MPTLLHIETSTNVCSVCLSENGKILIEEFDIQGQNHSKVAALFAKNVLDFAKQQHKNIDAIVVSAGPGSYTGLRIGISLAKGLCFGLSVPLIAINTLQIMANHYIQQQALTNNSIVCPMIDARRMEVYAAIYNASGEEVLATAPMIITENTFSTFDNNPIHLIGNGATKCKEVIKHNNIVFNDEVYPLASNMIALAETAYEKQNFENMAYFEPLYLKEFMVSTPKNKLA